MQGPEAADGHASVLLRETLELLAPRPGDTIVDATLGRAGHARAILERIGPGGRLVGVDRDPEAIARSREILRPYGEAVMLIQENFRNLVDELEQRRIQTVRGILLDLGVSSPQLESPERGFSFQSSGPLDMRMDPSQRLTAAEIIAKYPEDKLADIIWKYGQERLSRRIARRIVDERSRRRVATTAALAEIVKAAVPAPYRHGRLHPATRTFQALRIEVNDELGALERFLEDAPRVLDKGARLVIVSFHSLEDGTVKRAFKRYQAAGAGTVLTKKPVRPGQAETAVNPRARSARLRAFEKA